MKNLIQITFSPSLFEPTKGVGTYNYTFKSVVFESVKVKSVKVQKIICEKI